MTLRTVLLVSDFAHVNGGQAKVAIDSARLLADRGLEVVFFAACGPVDPLLDHPAIRVELLDQPDILSDPDRAAAARRGIWNGAALARLRALARSLDPARTVLHCHGYAKALSPSIGRVLAGGPLRAVYTMHEYFLACPNGGFYDYKRGEICTRRALGPACLSTDCDVRHAAHKAWRVARQVATRGPGRMPRGLRDIIHISRLQLRVMERYLPASARLHHVPNPLHLPDSPPVDAAANDVFLFVGRLNPEKGGRVFAEAARRAGVRAVFIGDGVEAAAVRAANPDAELLGWKPREEVQDWIGRARALVFPSLWYEGQPLVPMEAAARGVPVVCGTWSAAVECIEDGVSGVHYTSPDAASLADGLRSVRDLPAFDPAPIRAAVSPERHAERLLALYSRMLAAGAD